jgi:hypothetical protein
MMDPSKLTDDELRAKLGYAPKPLSTGEKVRGLALKAAQGATFGTASAVAPAAYAAAGKGFEFLKGVPKPFRTPFSELYKEGRKSFGEATGKVEKVMPKTSFATEVVAGLPMGVASGAKTIAAKAGLPLLKKLVPSAILGAKYGGAYGAGSQLGAGVEKTIEGNPLEAAKDVTVGGAKGAAIGAAIAPPLTAVAAPVIERIVPGVNKLIKAIFGKGKGVAAKDIITAVQNDTPLVHPADVVVGDIKPDLIQRSITENKPLIEIGDRNVVKLAQKARLNNENANEILAQHTDQVHAKQSPEIESVINKHLGSVSPSENVEAIQAKYKAEAEPLYAQAREHGEVKAFEGLIGEKPTGIDKSLQKYIAQARKGPLGLELDGLPDNNLSVLDAAKQHLDDEIGRAIRSGAKNEARALQGLKRQMVEKIDSEVPVYADARKVASDNLSLMEAQEEAGKFLKGETLETTKAKMKDYSPAEKEAFILGVRQDLINKLYTSSGTENRNIAQKVFESSEYGMLRRKLKEVLGAESYNKLMADINPLVKSGQNVSGLMGGSPTAERESIKGWSSIPRMLKKELSKSMSKKINESYEDVAKALTDPAYLRKILQSKTETPVQDFLTNTPNISGRIGGIQGSK